MEIVFVWSWLSFFAGIFATLSFAFWAVVFVAVRQYNKQKKKADSVTEFFKDWGTVGKER